jgi:hypothetical protein
MTRVPRHIPRPIPKRVRKAIGTLRDAGLVIVSIERGSRHIEITLAGGAILRLHHGGTRHRRCAPQYLERDIAKLRWQMAA